MDTNFTPEEVLDALEQVDKQLAEIEKQEDECITRIYTRFCLLHGLAIDWSKVRRKKYPENKNRWEYWFNYGKPRTPYEPGSTFLMSRELVIIDDQPKLNIVFSKELLNE